MRTQFTKVVVATALAVASVASLTACSGNDSLAQQYKSGTNKNYIAGDGTVSEYAKGSRQTAGAWTGKTESGATLSAEQLSGVVVVMNFWYAGCAPCRAEAKDLVALNDKFKGQQVQFIGVNVRDSAATALAFDRTFKISWPSILDASSGSVMLAFTGVVSPQAVPTTIVIDKTGKVAGRILGRLDKSTLWAIIQRVATE
ncbi:MAG: TlpA family protein disulfide reductase [Micrococcales bacterium]